MLELTPLPLGRASPVELVRPVWKGRKG